MTNIQEVFKSISNNLEGTEKHFSQIHISQTKNLNKENYLVLNESSFWDITFDQFTGYDIKMIDNDAFGESSSKIKSILIYYPIAHKPPEYDVWKMLSSLVNVQFINVRTDINEIPSQAFTPLNGKQTKLNTIYNSNYNKLIIKKMAFYNLENLTSIHFFHPEIQKIENEAFSFNKKSSQRLIIHFWYCIMNDSSFDSGSFDGIKRPTQILFDRLNISSIPESSFKSVLDNENNNVRFEYSYLNCFDCKNHWMIRDRKDKQVNNARCNHNTTLTLFSPQVRLKLNSNCKIRIKKIV